MNKITIGLLVAILVVCVVGFSLGRLPKSLGGTTNYDNLELDGTLTVDGASTFTGDVTHSGAVTNTGALTQTGAITANSSTFNGEITLGNCGTVLLRPGAIASGEEQRAGVTVTGIAAGDVALVSWVPASATSSLQSLSLNLLAYASSSNLAEAVFFNSSSSASSAVANSGTIRVCYFD